MDTQEDLAAAIAEYTEIIQEHGMDSAEARQFHARHEQLPEFSQLAEKVRFLSKHARPVSASPPVLVTPFQQPRPPFSRLWSACVTAVIGAAAVSMLVMVYNSSQVIAEARDEITRAREMIEARSQSALAMTRFLSAELHQRKYVIDWWGSGAKCDSEGLGNPERLLVTCKKHTDLNSLFSDPTIALPSYAGINTYVKAMKTGECDPVNLADVEQLSFEFRYPENSRGTFDLKLKNLDGYESPLVLITADGNRGEWQTFVLKPAENIRTKFLTESGLRSTLLQNIAISTNFADWGDWAQIEIRNLQITPQK